MKGMGRVKTYPNEHFYNADGSFNADTAKAAYYEMLEKFNYPISDRLRGEEFWAVDFAQGIFTEVGMAGILWVNSELGRYLGHEIYLLPGQMIPEHKHVETPDAAAKMEGWHVRHGSIHIYGEGEPTPGVEDRIPPSHKGICQATKEQQLLHDEVGELAGPGQWHWMRAGDEGAVVTEYGTYHDGNALRFTLPNVEF